MDERRAGRGTGRAPLWCMMYVYEDVGVRKRTDALLVAGLCCGQVFALRLRTCEARECLSKQYSKVNHVCFWPARMEVRSKNMSTGTSLSQFQVKLTLECHAVPVEYDIHRQVMVRSTY